MNKILCSLFLVITLYSVAESKIPVKLTFSGNLEIGSDVDSYNSFFDIQAAFNVYVWKCKFSFFGSNLSWVRLNWRELSGYPFRNIYSYGGQFEIAGFFIQCSHFCNHPVKSNMLHTDYITFHGEEYYRMNEKWWSNFWGETMTTISIGYEFEFTLYEK